MCIRDSTKPEPLKSSPWSVFQTHSTRNVDVREECPEGGCPTPTKSVVIIQLRYVCSLGALHDGDSNVCQSSSQNVMALGPQRLTNDTITNPFHFSACSVHYFRQHLAALTAYVLFTQRTQRTQRTLLSLRFGRCVSCVRFVTFVACSSCVYCVLCVRYVRCVRCVGFTKTPLIRLRHVALYKCVLID